MTSRSFIALCLLILVLEALGALLVSHVGHHAVLGGDGPNYLVYARDLVDHGVFSDRRAAPFNASVFRTPGYPVFLAGVRLVVGSWSLVAVRIVQFVLLGVTAWLVWLIGRRLFDELVARLAAVLTVTYLPLIWLARLHMTESLATTLITLIVLLLVAVSPHERVAPARLMIALGALIGVAAYVRPDLAGLVVFIAAAFAIQWIGSSTTRVAGIRVVAVLAISVLVVIGPWGVRNYRLTHRVIPLGSAVGDTLLYAALEWNGTLTPKITTADVDRFTAEQVRALAKARGIPPRAAHRALAQLSQSHDAQMEYISRYTATARAEVAFSDAEQAAARRVIDRVTFGQLIRRLPAMLAYLWGTADNPNSPAEYASWHPIAQIQYAVLIVAFLVGLAATARKWGRRFLAIGWPLLIPAIYETVVHLVFSVDERYTVPVRPVLLLFSAAGACTLWRYGFAKVRTSQRRESAASADAA